MVEHMRAVRVHEYGGPDVLSYETVPRPDPGEGEVLVRVHAAGVNPVDCSTRRGRGPVARDDPFPYVPGWDVSGVVRAVGDGVSAIGVGDPVYGMVRFPGFGETYAEYAAVPAAEVARFPDVLDHAEAAALPLVALTAWQALVETADVGPGDRVLVHGAAGGVGHVAVQLARHRGATVVGTASTEHASFLGDLGVERAVDYGTERFEEVLDPVDVVLDGIGGETRVRSFRVLRDGGLLVSIKGDPMADVAAEHGVRVTRVLVEPDATALESITELVVDGALAPALRATFPLREAAAAHRLVEPGHGRGKVVLRVR